MHSEINRITPFLKWAGGKRWLVEKHGSMLAIEHNRYIEPFLGSGAVFFSLLPQKSILGDANTQLIETYSCLKTDWQKVQKLLSSHHKSHSSEYYYSMRSSVFKSAIERSAQFIYLNRTCWNGLYRVNKKGEFNVPIGSKSNVILESDDFESLSKALSTAELVAGDFEALIDRATSGDFVFVDPPYTVKHNYNGFVKYNENIFSWDDQIRLCNAVKRASTRGAKLVITNAYHESIRKIYKDVGKIIKLNRPSVIAGKSSARGRYEEMVIKCF
ncbi:DNA adenine methylase [Acidovorax sp.]|uniref:DNA adenine methylase n=1 Tax=Acidovorax sp. TaxID=1872122 RepID=UPI00391FAB9C